MKKFRWILISTFMLLTLLGCSKSEEGQIKIEPASQPAAPVDVEPPQDVK